MQPCAVGGDTDMGDFIIDFLENPDEEDVFNNIGLQMLREGILTGNLRKMCRDCFFASNELITTEAFEEQLKDFLRQRVNIDVDKADLTKVYAYDWMAISFTNRCNLSCIYCVQSVHKDTNPFYKMEIPDCYAEKILDYMASKGIFRISTCVEGEATLYKQWCEIFTTFHKKYPYIEMFMTTNLNREFSNDDIELLTNYTQLDISIDSLNPELYADIRRHGKLELLLKNIDKIDRRIKERGIKGPTILLHMVVSDKTWTEIESIAEFAFSRGYGIQLGNYEERENSVAYRDKILQPISAISIEDQNKVAEIIERVKNKANELGIYIVIQGDIANKVNKQVNHNYNRFNPFGQNPFYEAFYKQYPKGEKGKHLDVVYDHDNIAHAGILFGRDESVKLKDIQTDAESKAILREVYIYKDGTVSNKFKQNVLPGYREIITFENDNIEIVPKFEDTNIEKILVEIEIL